MVIKAHSPAGFAEQYIVESIWNGGFPPGSILPAERELSELIGVTRTTLREVLQRLARDGWLTIKHGKPTKVNNFWETSSLNILETLAQLDQEGIPDLVDNLMSARTNISAIYIRGAIKNNAEKVIELIKAYEDVEDNGEAFAEFDYRLNKELVVASGNSIYLLILNGFRGLYSRLGTLYFSHPKGREISRVYYKKLIELASEDKFDESIFAVRKYGIESGKLWLELKDDVLKELSE
ncbi:MULTISPECIES: fatty acid metabolism transcriptional regulator FadR [unclassified Colwellia]|jgi:GntR family negative regulator for fad regulon and positive regulator of fabA|uniref:fatty acid metabolism transcriptional regulator FadR n=1 Tax=unclassified Colwellia TaxID=196834 RepID=UPI0015F35EFC|nr:MULTISPECIES: fatty acid metabolism transcriptional regulator FadR [unclassified Colwellia]MBA6364134.1 fatty acid metabolism transcriptional regulator FadR [Colwellia sp. BRX8-8]MBA6336224.1 fatty acid metabolism transcriptional regulator FadR [Colwellia sp. BRX8-7]MBA6349306.1 fatty acid metabolism transcriptional regulator FadR [Colwellia sp. BRX8-9]MBA6352657.1 fatty acid metabolism transcriptional regulator FadR [Colwellia sp. BRX9-1]MBA6356468.1 fatty acid metabolism transcriptional r|tara:strand:- start:6707 stop:7417 length:711 start_codon:yes stop_codon:yes gene_type:complete